MDDSIFRKKSLDRISSPEEIDDYMKVTKPSMWLAMAAIILLLAAAIIWSVTARIQTTIETTGQVDNGQVTATVAEDDLKDLSVGSEAYVDKQEGTVTAVNGKGEDYEVVAEVPEVDDGVVNVSFVTESIAPISFLTK